MPTINPRINLTFDPELYHAVQMSAKLEDKTVSCVARDLIIDALERRKDTTLSSIANIRDAKNEN